MSARVHLLITSNVVDKLETEPDEKSGDGHSHQVSWRLVHPADAEIFYRIRDLDLLSLSLGNWNDIQPHLKK